MAVRNKLKPDYGRIASLIIGILTLALDGSISVFISKKDYEKYRERLTFDELCASLGEVFKRFFALHRAGGQDQITARLKDIST